MINVIRKFFRGGFFSQVLRKLFSFINFGSIDFRINESLVGRPHYGYCMLHAVKLAKKLGINGISVIEFGCFGGNGLRSLELFAAKLSKKYKIRIQIYGFDTGTGLPDAKDYRDLMYVWKKNDFAMQKDSYVKDLNNSKIVYGDVKKTIKTFIKDFKPFPIGAIYHDMDYFSSTWDSFQLFNESSKNFLPRVFNYFDDITGNELELFNDFTGERLAINQFNKKYKNKKFSISYNLTCRSYPQSWFFKIRILHIFNHPLYNKFIND